VSSIRSSIGGPIVGPVIAPLGSHGLPWDASGGAGVYDPATEAGVLMHLSAQSGITQAGTGVSSWVDRKGAKDFVQGTDANRPTYEAAGLGGRPSVLWVKANTDALVCASGPVSTTKTYSLIAVVDPVTNTNTEYLLDSAAGRAAWCLNVNASSNVGYLDGAAFDAIAASTLPPQILRWTITSGNALEVFRGNTSLGTATATSNDLGGAMGLGCNFAAGANIDARVSEVVLSTTLDSARDARIMAYFSSYYGIAL
jgi:hypothetical protein